VKAITTCRACDSTRLTEFLDLGKQYLSDFRKDDVLPPKYPLVAVFCEDCKLVQLKHTTPQPEMYHDRYGFKSGISASIKADLDDIVIHAFQYKNDPTHWLDIASNDGTLLSFVPSDVFKVGVDPVTFLCEEAKPHADWIINDFFDAKYFQAQVGEYEALSQMSFDVITSISCFYDMPDPNKFVADVKSVLAPKGIWIIQQNYLLTTMQINAVDNFCHEHIEYYTLLSLENLLHKHGLEVNEVYVSDVNGGSIRTVVSHGGAFPVDASVKNQRTIEWEHGLEDSKVYHRFANDVGEELDKLHRLVKRLHDEGSTIAILAASTRGATIWQSADIGANFIEYAVERNPAKVGAMFSAVGIPIVSEEQFRKDQPDYAIIAPWFFAPEIIDREADYLKAGGKLIQPLPEVTIHEETSDTATDL
jgi:NDP-4-keto-2,6-dideoxyhexose 3-C-methyltransferase